MELQNVLTEQIDIIKQTYEFRQVFICLNISNDGVKIPISKLDKISD